MKCIFGKGVTDILKTYGDIECFNDGTGIKHIFGDGTKALCGEQAVLVRDYYGRKDYMLRRNIEAITCNECKEKYLDKHQIER